MDRVLHREPARTWRRLVVRLALFAFCGGLLLLLSSRPAEAAERREPGLLDPVRTTLKATAREVDSFAGRATGSGASTAASAVKRGAPAVPSPVRRAAPPTRPATSAVRTATRSTGAAAKPVTGTLTGLLQRAGKLAAKPVTRVTKPVAKLTAPVAAPVAKLTAPVAELTAPVAQVAAPLLKPVGSALAPVGAALAPVTAPVAGLVPPVATGGLPLLPGLAGPESGPATGRPAAGPVGRSLALLPPARLSRLATSATSFHVLELARRRFS